MSANDSGRDPWWKSANAVLAVGDTLLETQVYRTCKILSAIWAGCLLAYFLVRPGNFLRMWPQEFGSLLSGWAAPLAALWVFATVLLQRAQLRAQSLHMELTSEELRNSVDQLKKNVTNARLLQLSKRMMHGALRLAKASDRPGFYLVRQSENEPASDLLGDYRTYAALFKANEANRVLSLLGSGMLRLVSRMREDCVLHADCTALEELCIELISLRAIVSEMRQLAEPEGASLPGDGHPPKAALESFGRAATELNELFVTLLRDLREFDLPPAGSPAMAITTDL